MIARASIGIWMNVKLIYDNQAESLTSCVKWLGDVTLVAVVRSYDAVTTEIIN